MFSASALTNLGDFSEVVLIDTEFVSKEGERVVPVALVAHELRSGRRHRLFFEMPGTHYENPLPQGPDILYVAYAAQAEWSAFRALGWELPEYVVDLFAEFRAVTNGLSNPAGRPIDNRLIGALTYFGLDSMTVAEKQEMRDLILRGHPYSASERQEIIDYCSEDVEALEMLLPVMLPFIDLPYVLFRGRYSKAVASIEHSGIPVDTATLELLMKKWAYLKERIAREVEDQYGFGVFEGRHWRHDRFAALIDRMGLLDEWPRTDSGLMLSVEDEVFKTMAARFPVLQPLRDLRALTRLNEIGITAGTDGRSRYPVKPFQSVTGRNYPPTSKFIFGPCTWLRSLIKPAEGRAVAYIDWSSAEFGIAAALSGDERMKSAYEFGDIYMSLAIDAGAAPKGATKDTHPELREVYKRVVLGVQYGQTAFGLARTLGVPIWRAQELLNLHRRVYKRYWEWNEWVSQSATFGRKMETVFGWPMHVTSKTKPNTISNFPMQANGSEMLRWACTFATERGIEVHAPVQDALLVGGAAQDIDDLVAATEEAMAEASDLVLDGFILRSKPTVVRYPDRYMDQRGVEMWNRIMSLLDGMEQAA